MLAIAFALTLAMTHVFESKGQNLPSDRNATNPVASSAHYVTNVSQFRMLSAADYIEGCSFRLNGVVTLADTNRDLVVLQDSTGAVGLNFKAADQKIEVGQMVRLDGRDCCPLVSRFPDFPYHPSGHDIRSSFEAPMNWGEYHLTRMRGYLHPPVTGNYRFWIASDNSSELWLSTDATAAKARRIASVQRFGWVAAHQWSKYSSQHSDAIPLKAGETYYIEALQEQTDQAENLSVGWQTPSTNGSAIEVIDGQYLTPSSGNGGPASDAASGILREYWTNYTAADLTGLGGARPFESALSVRNVSVTVEGAGELPQPEAISLSQRLSPEKNYRWVQIEGAVKFNAADGDTGVLEISDGLAQIQVRVPHWTRQFSQKMTNAIVRVEGVCEGGYDRNDTLVPGLIWAAGTNCISLVRNAITNLTESGQEPARSAVMSSQAMGGFYGTRGVVTFNDRVFDRDYIFIQEDAAVMLVDVSKRPFANRLEVGQRVDLGGTLEPGKAPPVITPNFVEDLGRQPMPLPIIQPLGSLQTGNQQGKWSELEGVVRSVNPNRTLALTTKDGPASLWLGCTPSNLLATYVDAKVRARGVLLEHLLDVPVLLIPSRSFFDTVKAAPANPFAMVKRSIASIRTTGADMYEHRVRVSGEITYRDDHSFFVQDLSGGIRVQTPGPPANQVGEAVEVAAFPAMTGSARCLIEPVIRPASGVAGVPPKDLNLVDSVPSETKGTLVRLNATLLARKTNGSTLTLELQEQQRVFFASLMSDEGNLPRMLPGSRVRITGVCDDETPVSSVAGNKPARAEFLSAPTILLRRAQDVVLLSGPPWWTWKKAAWLVGLLLTVLATALLWVHLLHRRLERQRAAQVAFSQQVLGKLEEERRRIAVNLHDSLGQTLLVIKNHALLASRSTTEGQGIQGRLDEISGATSQAIEEVRRITHGLRPYQLDRLGLTQAIRASVNAASENSQIQFASRVEDIDGLFEKDAEIHVYRIVQEAVTNVVKHSAATEATVVIKKRDGSVSISIRDNGRGFDPAKTSSPGNDLGYGLTGITERVRILKGTLVIDSQPGSGTNLTVEAPYKST